MKTTLKLIVAFLFLSTVFTACSKDNDPVANLTSDISGTYKPQTYESMAKGLDGIFAEGAQAQHQSLKKGVVPKGATLIVSREDDNHINIVVDPHMKAADVMTFNHLKVTFNAGVYTFSSDNKMPEKKQSWLQSAYNVDPNAGNPLAGLKIGGTHGSIKDGKLTLEQDMMGVPVVKIIAQK